MPTETSLSVEVPRPSGETVHSSTSLQEHLSAIDKQETLIELILALDSHDPRSPIQSETIQGLMGKVQIDLGSRDSLNLVVVAVGRRLDELRSLQANQGALTELSDTNTLTSHLLVLFEHQRRRHLPAEHLLQALHETTDGVFNRLQNRPDATKHELGFYEAALEEVKGGLIPAYEALAPKLNRLEDNAFTGLLLSTPWMMGLLTALPALLTFVMPISTPIALLSLFIVGTFLIHPVWVQLHRAPLTAVAETLTAQQERLSRISGQQPWEKRHFSTPGLLQDVIPSLDAQRLAGHCEKEQLLKSVDRHFATLQGPSQELGLKDSPYLQHQKDLLSGEVLHRYQAWARGSQWIEGAIPRRILNKQGISGVVFTMLMLPFSYVASRISPLPPSLDLPLLLLLFAAVGYWAPRLIPGTKSNKKKMLEDLSGRQEEIQRLIQP